MKRFIYKKSFVAKLVLERGLALESYQAMKDLLSTYRVSTRVSFDHELISVNRKSVAMIRVGRKNSILYVDLPFDKAKEIYKGVVDASNVASYKKYPVKLTITNKLQGRRALELIKEALADRDTFPTLPMEIADYDKEFYPRTFTELFKEGLIKQYEVNVKGTTKSKVIKKVKENDTDNMHKVTFTAKLLYCAEYQAEDLFIVTSVNNWDTYKAIKMDRVGLNEFTAIDFFPTGTYLEFKICRANNWDNVEKGIWKEEIVNHHYLIENDDLEVEDLIHNFREF